MNPLNFNLTSFDRSLTRESVGYRGIIQSPDTGLIDYDSTMPGKTRPTFGATRVADLIDTVTNSYDKLRKFSHKMRFLIEIQAEILDQYQGRLSESLDAYSTITNPVARKFHGISREQQAELEGIKGLESLCKVYGSAEYIINVLHEWSDSEASTNLNRL
jgi:RAD50-interacting protein 1